MHRSILFLTLTALLLGGCVYRQDIQQGNFLDAEKIAQVKPGMTQEQVQFLLGTAQIQDPFHPNRWDYVFYLDSQDDERDAVRRLTVFFTGNTVSRINTDTPDVAGVTPQTSSSSETANTTGE